MGWSWSSNDVHRFKPKRTERDMLMRTLLLICTLDTPQADCSTATAQAVIQGPEAASLVECGLHGQGYIAHGAIAGYLDGAHYLKITCTSGERRHGPTIQPTVSAPRPPSAAQAID
jgi:hypothetical protein